MNGLGFNHKFSLVCSLAILLPILASAPALAQMPPPVDTAGSDTAVVIQRDTVKNIVLGISNRFSPLTNALSLPGAPDGVESGVSPVAYTPADNLAGWSVWTSGANTWTRNKLTATKSHGTIQTATIGADYKLNSMITAGLSANYSHSNIKTVFNGGKKRTNGGSIIPYVNLTINDWLSSNISIGYSFGKTKQSRIVGATPVNGSYNNHGLVVAANLNAAKWQGSWLFATNLGLLYNSSRQVSFIESNGTVNAGNTDNLTQMSIGGTISYLLRPVLPYLSVVYKYDISRDKSTTPGVSNDRDEFELGAGFTFYGTGTAKNMTAGLGVTTIVGRKNKRNTTASANLRYSF